MTNNRLRIHRTTWAVSAAFIVLGPIALAAWETARAPFTGFTRMTPERYLGERNPVIDALLPDGAGGTHYFEDIGGPAGLASIAKAAIAVAPADLSAESIEAVELHERGHLLYAANLEVMTRLLAQLRSPSPSEYAAENAGEHVGEMAATAWGLIAPLENMCLVDPPGVRLRLADDAVPGTAGFVALFLQHAALHDIDGREALAAAADSLVGPHRYAWMAVWGTIEGRRRGDGKLAPWPALSVREQIEAMREEGRTDGSLLRRAAAVLLWPSAALAGTVDSEQ